MAKSVLPVPAPPSLSPVGSLIIGRIANATGFCCHCDIRFIFAPIQKSPSLLPLQPSFISGLVGTVPPACGTVERNSGRMSRSTRLTSVQAPNTSARSLRPKAKVTGHWEMSLKPWLSSKLTGYALTDHLRSGSTSAVGTLHRPVSPRNVVVAGRVSVELVAAAGFAGAAGVCDGVWAAADPAAVSARTPAARAC